MTQRREEVATLAMGRGIGTICSSLGIFLPSLNARVSFFEKRHTIFSHSTTGDHEDVEEFRLQKRFINLESLKSSRFGRRIVSISWMGKGSS
jgi:hypothetical protein